MNQTKYGKNCYGMGVKPHGNEGQDKARYGQSAHAVELGLPCYNSFVTKVYYLGTPTHYWPMPPKWWGCS